MVFLALQKLVLTRDDAGPQVAPEWDTVEVVDPRRHRGATDSEETEGALHLKFQVHGLVDPGDDKPFDAFAVEEDLRRTKTLT